MRVTKIIREYVEKTITAKMPYGDPSKKFNEARKRLNNICEELNKKVESYATQLIEVANESQPVGFKLYLYNGYSLVCESCYDAPLAIAAGEHERAIRKKREDAIERILVELELGATKADLERLIAEAIGE